MKPNPSSFGISRRALLSTLALLPGIAPRTATAQQTKRGAGSVFSFAVYGDSRSMMYLPYKSDQREEATRLMVDIFDLALPEKVSAEMVKRDVKLTYDPATGELVQQNRPKANYRGAAKQRLDSITSMAPGTLVRDHWLLEPGGLSNH